MTRNHDVVVVNGRPARVRSVPLLAEHQIGHYPEFRAFFSSVFGLDADPFRAPGVIRVGGRHYELVFVGYSGQPFPAGVRIAALVPGLEPMDEEQALSDLWAFVAWMIDGVGGAWDVGALKKTGRIYRISGRRV
ncbi:hypothetical protein DMH01_32340 [Amycolatopsis sp. WAC 04182]|uniref:hypothetical protein n=1 Tax=Amycolatopsis sp. WAC 04182 TaxID=2203198 RepID=UPI000F7B2B8D|nr:hypothetical protein [Amycolatopsis sp. WAC 04182]RSN55036.1 hypothetical protein DMH01_32340 [Amycolatopsis sp. WAC 04182]